MPRNLPSPPHNPLEGTAPELSIPLVEDSTSEMISVIIVSHEEPEYLNILLQSIVVNSLNQNNLEIIVTDQNSGQDTQDFLTEIEGEVKVIRNDKNLYFSQAINQAMKAVNPNSKYIICLHSDTVILSPVWTDLLINVSESQNSGFVGVDMSSYYIGGGSGGSGTKIDFIQDFCFLVTPECWKQCGPYPEELPIIGGPFIFTLKAQQAGFNPQVIKNSLVHHYRRGAINFSVLEREQERCLSVLPRLMRDIQAGKK